MGSRGWYGGALFKNTCVHTFSAELVLEKPDFFKNAVSIVNSSYAWIHLSLLLRDKSKRAPISRNPWNFGFARTLAVLARQVPIILVGSQLAMNVIGYM